MINKPDFLRGYLACCQFIVIGHGQDTIAENALTESGYSINQLLKAQRESGFESKRMNKVIRKAIRKGHTPTT